MRAMSEIVAAEPPARSRWVSLAVAARALGCSTRHARRLCAEGVISGASRVGPRGHWKVARQWIDAINESAKPAKPDPNPSRPTPASGTVGPT